MATIEASRPTMRPSASIITHFFSTSAGFAEKVFIMLPSGMGRVARRVRRLLAAATTRVNTIGDYRIFSSSCVGVILLPLSGLRRDRIGRAPVRNNSALPFREYIAPTDGEPFAELDQAYFGK